MQNPIFERLNVINRKEAKRLAEKIAGQFDASTINIDKILKNYVLLKNRDEKIFLVCRDFAHIEPQGLRINTIGLYFCKIDKNGFIRLSMEGSQIIGPNAKRITLLNGSEAGLWLKGEAVPVSMQVNGYTILRNGDDFLGCGFIKDKEIINYVPKERRLKEVI